MLDYHQRLQNIRHLDTEAIVEPSLWSKIVGDVEWRAWFPVTRAVSPRGINVTILEHVNA